MIASSTAVVAEAGKGFSIRNWRRLGGESKRERAK